MKTTRTAAIAAFGFSTLLLAACSGGSTGSQGSVFEFQANGVEPDSEITIRIPDDLREALGSQAGGILVNSVYVTPHDLDGLQYCGVDLVVDYADGGLDALAVETTTSSAEPAFTEEEAEELAERYRDDPEGMVEEFNARGIDPRDLSGFGESVFYRYADGGDVTTEDLVTMLVEMRVRGERTVPGWENLAKYLTGVSRDAIGQIADLDGSEPRRGAYVHDDLQTITVVTNCATSANDEDAAVSFVFPEANGDSIGTFAETPITVMTDGTLGVTGTVRNYQRDSNDNWIAA